MRSCSGVPGSKRSSASSRQRAPGRRAPGRGGARRGSPARGRRHGCRRSGQERDRRLVGVERAGLVADPRLGEAEPVQGQRRHRGCRRAPGRSRAPARSARAPRRSRSSERSTAACSFSRIASRRPQLGGATRRAPSSRRDAPARATRPRRQPHPRPRAPAASRSLPAVAPSRPACRELALAGPVDPADALDALPVAPRSRAPAPARAGLECRAIARPCRPPVAARSRPPTRRPRRMKREADRDEERSPEHADRGERGQSSFVLRQLSRHAGSPFRDGLQPYLFAPLGGAPPPERLEQELSLPRQRGENGVDVVVGVVEMERDAEVRVALGGDDVRPRRARPRARARPSSGRRRAARAAAPPPSRRARRARRASRATRPRTCSWIAGTPASAISPTPATPA